MECRAAYFIYLVVAGIVENASLGRTISADLASGVRMGDEFPDVFPN